ncbi:Mfs general substrate transporter [Diaporthe eres]|nr:Mfs general substrate transporter [Diaporthe eres]
MAESASKPADAGSLAPTQGKVQEMDITHQENAVGYREYLEAMGLEASDRELRKLRWKIDLVILPMFLITQALQFMDKTSLNYANILGYQAALGLKGQEFNYLSAMGVRFLMGLFEAAVTPSAYDTHSSSLGWGGIIGSYIAMGVSKLPVDANPERWQLLFYVLGGVTCLWAFVVWFALPDSPSNAWFLNHRERLLGVKRVSDNETGIKNKAFDKKQALVGFFDPKALLLFISVFSAAIPNGVVNSFSTVIIRDMGFDTTTTTQLKSVGDAVQIVALLIGGTFILNVPNSRLITATVANLLCTVSAACMAYLAESNTWGRLVAFWLVNAHAMVFTAYCWGNFAGPFAVKQSEAPHFRGATIGLLVGYAIKLVCHLALLLYMLCVNRYRNRRYGEPDREQSKEAGMRDHTEFENKDFRYVL